MNIQNYVVHFMITDNTKLKKLQLFDSTNLEYYSLIKRNYMITKIKNEKNN